MHSSKCQKTSSKAQSHVFVSLLLDRPHKSGRFLSNRCTQYAWRPPFLRPTPDADRQSTFVHELQRAEVTVRAYRSAYCSPRSSVDSDTIGKTSIGNAWTVNLCICSASNSCSPATLSISSKSNVCMSSGKSLNVQNLFNWTKSLP